MTIYKNGSSEDEVVSQAIFKMMEEKGFPESQRMEEKERIESLIDERTMDELLSALPTEKLVEVREILGTGDSAGDKFFEIVEESGIKIESVAKKVFEDFREEYLKDNSSHRAKEEE